MLPAFAAKMSMLTMATFTNGNILAWLHVPHGFPRCDVVQKKKKKKVPKSLLLPHILL